MTKKYFLFVVLLALSATFFQTALAEENTDQDGLPEFSEMVDHFVSELETAEIIMAGDSWTPADLEQYLYNAMSVVLYARVDASIPTSQDIPQINNDMTLLVDMGYLPFWPSDPMNNWEPMTVVTPEDGFHPNALCLSLCPMAYASPLPSGGTGQVSFDLFVYGPDESFSMFASVIQPEMNKEWSEVPAGALYGNGMRMNTVEEYEENRRLSEIYKAQQAELEAEESGTP